jgi:hypothetical protein
MNTTDGAVLYAFWNKPLLFSSEAPARTKAVRDDPYQKFRERFLIRRKMKLWMEIEGELHILQTID